MRVAVTGATGFVGKAVVEHLVSRQHEVIALGRDYRRLDNLFGKRVHCRETDYAESELNTKLHQADAVVHLAGRLTCPSSILPAPLEDFWWPNIRTTENLLRSSLELGIERFVLASTRLVYSQFNCLPFSESESARPMVAYGLSKLICEHLGQLYETRGPLSFIALRLAQVYGWGDPHSSALSQFVNAAMNGQPCTVLGQGKAVRDYLYLKDACNALEAALAPQACSGVYNIGSGTEYSIAELAEAVAHVFHNDVRRQTIRHEDTSKYVLDCSKAACELGWTPRWTLNAALDEIRAEAVSSARLGNQSNVS